MSTRTVTITAGSLRNNLLYVPLDFFPEDAIGGSNKSEPADRAIQVTFSPGRTVETDIDCVKRIIRARGAVGEFFAQGAVREGDVITLRKISSHKYEVSKSNE